MSALQQRLAAGQETPASSPPSLAGHSGSGVSPLAGTYGSGSEVPVITIAPDGTVSAIDTNTVETSGFISGSGAAGTYGDTTHVVQITVNAKGQITAISNVALTPNVSFGSGAPGALVAEAALYFDTSASPYTAYVQHSGAWHQIA